MLSLSKHLGKPPSIDYNARGRGFPYNLFYDYIKKDLQYNPSCC